MNKKRVFIVAAPLLLCSLGLAAADPVEEYRRACETAHFDALSVMTHPLDPVAIDWGAAEAPCRAFIRGMEAAPADDNTRLALFLAKYWLGDLPPTGGEEYCEEASVLVERLPDNDDALFQWSHCVPDDARAAIRKGLMERGHPLGTFFMVGMFNHAGDYQGVPPEAFARYAEAFYEDARDVSERFRAALAIYRIALDTGARYAGDAIRERLISDHGLDSLDYAPAHRDKSLERACNGWMFDMDLGERLCLPALEAFAAEALARGEAIPDDVLRHMGGAFKESEAKGGVGNDTGERLAAILAAHPETLRSSEHLRVLAKTAILGSPERLDGLRRAVEVDSGNLRARCDLAAALTVAGENAEATVLYEGLVAEGGAPCAAGHALSRLTRQ